jgi:hypothetical protein
MTTYAFFKYTKNVYFTEHITNLTSVHMGRSALGKFLFISIMCFVYLQSCVKDDPATLIPPAPKDQSFVEEFDTVGAAYDRGWRYINVSLPRGPGFWNQGMFNNPNITNLPLPFPLPLTLRTAHMWDLSEPITLVHPLRPASSVTG